jgi:deazaflavin-dependent oxidoreductase (nitroreductase family)
MAAWLRLVEKRSLVDGNQAGWSDVTVKVPPGGTRGLRLPRFLARLGNRMMLRSFRRGGARTQGGIETLMLETVGAQSGQARQSVLGFLPDGNDAWLVIASLAGAARNRAWLHNLAAQPDATIQFEDGDRVDVRAETLDGPDLAAGWQRLEREAPEFPKYRTKTDREMAIVRLRRR